MSKDDYELQIQRLRLILALVKIGLQREDANKAAYFRWGQYYPLIIEFTDYIYTCDQLHIPNVN